MRRLLSFAFVVGCGGGHSKVPDAAASIDAPGDAPVDAALDAAPDVAIDGAVDAGIDALVMLPPPCPTASTILVDTSPRRITTMAEVGGVLYVGVYNPNVSTDVAVLMLDPGTGASVASPFVPAAGVGVEAGPDAAYAAEGASNGSIWRLVPGHAAVAVVTGRPTPELATSDGTYVYWAEKNPTQGQPEIVQRQAISGGAVQQVMTGCAGPSRIVVNATDLYCVEFQSGTVHRAPKDGSAAAQTVAYSGAVGGGYPVASMVEEGTKLYLANLYNNPQVWGAPEPSGPFTVVEQSANLGRYVGLTATPTYLYAVDNSREVIDRIDPAAHTVVTYPAADNVTYASPEKDPIAYNGQLYYIAMNYSAFGDRYIMHCVP